MSVTLLDVNVLVALFDPAHPNHEDAHAWFAKNRKQGWATCPITINGCVRVLSNPAYPTVEASPEDVVSRLRVICAAPEHEFWTDSASLLDESVFHVNLVGGHQMITDVYLVGLAVRQQGRLATLDRKISWKAVVGATAQHLTVIARAPV